MKERPILFSGPMVSALLAGTKTQTRRVVKATRDPNIGCWMSPGEIALDSSTVQEFTSPYGRPGDRLWVREARARTKLHQAQGLEMVVYREGDNRTDYSGPWKPGIHMFRCDCRILLEINGVRVERLQDISEEDAKAEGAEPAHWHVRDEVADLIDWPLKESASPYRNGFALLWVSINGPDSWAANPWVWVIDFKLTDKPETAL